MIVVTSPATDNPPEPVSMSVSARPVKTSLATSNLPIELSSAYDFNVTLQRLLHAIEGAGLKIFARIDHQAKASAVGLTMPPTTVLIYGNPKVGIPLMLSKASIALDLPLRVLVRERADGAVLVSFHSGTSIVANAGLGADDAAGLVQAEKIIADAIRP